MLIQATPDEEHYYKISPSQKQLQNIKVLFFECFPKKNARDHNTSIDHLLNHLKMTGPTTVLAWERSIHGLTLFGEALLSRR